MKTTRVGSSPLHSISSAVLLGVALFCCAVAPARAGDHVLHVTAAAPSNNLIYLDDPNLNGKPGAKLIVTQRLGVANDHPIGVWFDQGQGRGPEGRWSIFNEDNVDMPANAEFNLLVGSFAKISATTANSALADTHLKAAAGKPPFNPPPTAPVKLGFLFFTHTWEPLLSLGAGVYVNHHQAMIFQVDPIPNAFFRKWAISNLDRAAAVVASYFVLDASTAPKGATVFGHSTTNANSPTGTSRISNPAIDNLPDPSKAVLFITPLTYFAADKAVAVYYDIVSNQWTIANEDGTSIAAGQDFNVLVFPGTIP